MTKMYIPGSHLSTKSFPRATRNANATAKGFGEALFKMYYVFLVHVGEGLISTVKGARNDLENRKSSS